VYLSPTTRRSRTITGMPLATAAATGAVSGAASLGDTMIRFTPALALLGLQDEAGKFTLTEDQSEEIRDRLGDVLWYLALLCSETGITMQDLAAHSVTQLNERMKGLDADRR
jgi:NTP pyrophosphatase (non-canonical NTP hydrolase)